MTSRLRFLRCIALHAAVAFCAGAAGAGEPGGDIVLAARAATLTGGGLIQYQSATNRDCIGHWNGTSNTVGWTFDAPERRTYRVVLNLACVRGQEGSTFEVEAAGQTAAGTVVATGDWGVFTNVDVGPLMIRKPGRVELVVRPKTVARAAVMNLREVRLVPDG